MTTPLQYRNLWGPLNSDTQAQPATHWRKVESTDSQFCQNYERAVNNKASLSAFSQNKRQFKPEEWQEKSAAEWEEEQIREELRPTGPLKYSIERYVNYRLSDNYYKKFCDIIKTIHSSATPKMNLSKYFFDNWNFDGENPVIQGFCVTFDENPPGPANLHTIFGTYFWYLQKSQQNNAADYLTHLVNDLNQSEERSDLIISGPFPKDTAFSTSPFVKDKPSGEKDTDADADTRMEISKLVWPIKIAILQEKGENTTLEDAP